MQTQEPPTVRVVRGEPTDEELAALVGALAVVARTAAPAPPRRYSYWLRGARPGTVTGGLPTRRDRYAWRISTLPR